MFVISIEYINKNLIIFINNLGLLVSFFILFSMFLVTIIDIASKLEKKLLKTKILLGNYILNNSNIFENDNTIFNYLISQLPRNKIYNYAVPENIKINDCYNLVLKIPIEINNSNCIIFLSIGIYDIYELYKQNTINKEKITQLFIKYCDLIKFIKRIFTLSRIVSITINYPLYNNVLHKQNNDYIQYIKLWNNLLETNKEIIKIEVLDITTIIIEKNDLINNKYLSLIGGNKISRELLKYK